MNKSESEHIISTEKKKPGQTVFSYNIDTGEIKKAETSTQDAPVNVYGYVLGPGKIKISMEPGCVYRQALNKSNLIKKLRKEGFTIK